MAKGNKGKNTKAIPVSFDPAEEVEQIAKKLIAKNHSHLATCKVAYLFKNRAIKAKGRNVVATAKKISAENRVLSGYHFLITVAYPTWKELDDKVKLAVVDHELEHCFVDDDEKTGEPKYSILDHDVADFRSIILRHGLYTVDLVQFGTVASNALASVNKSVVVKKVGDVKAKDSDDDEDEEDDEILDDGDEESEEELNEEFISDEV